MNPWLFFALLVSALVAIDVASRTIRKRKCERLVIEWAKKEKVEILEKSCPWFDQGPFTLRSTQLQRVYRIKIRTSDRQIKVIWARFGHPFLGFWIPRISIKDEEA